jgi:hypothetical protein
MCHTHPPKCPVSPLSFSPPTPLPPFKKVAMGLGSDVEGDGVVEMVLALGGVCAPRTAGRFEIDPPSGTKGFFS